MSDRWQYQVRIDLAAEPAEIARRDPGNPALGPLTDILARHDAIMSLSAHGGFSFQISSSHFS